LKFGIWDLYLFKNYLISHEYKKEKFAMPLRTVKLPKHANLSVFQYAG